MELTYLFTVDLFIILTLLCFIQGDTSPDSFTSTTTATSKTENPVSSTSLTENIFSNHSNSSIIYKNVTYFNQSADRIDFVSFANVSSDDMTFIESGLDDIELRRTNNSTTTKNVNENLNLTISTEPITDTKGNINVLVENGTEIYTDRETLNNTSENTTRSETTIDNTSRNTTFGETKIDTSNYTSESTTVGETTIDTHYNTTDDETIPDTNLDISDDQNTTATNTTGNINVSEYVNEISTVGDNSTDLLEETDNTETITKDTDDSVTSGSVIMSTESISNSKTSPITKLNKQILPPPLLVPPPPYPPDDISKTDGDKSNIHFQQIPDTSLNKKFQPRAEDMSPEMRKAMLDPNNIIIATSTKSTKSKKVPQKAEEIFEPDLPPPPPRSVNSESDKTTDDNIQQSTSFEESTPSVTPKLEQSPRPTSKKPTPPSIDIQKPIVLPPPPPPSANKGSPTVPKPTQSQIKSDDIIKPPPLPPIKPESPPIQKPSQSRIDSDDKRQPPTLPKAKPEPPIVPKTIVTQVGSDDIPQLLPPPPPPMLPPPPPPRSQQSFPRDSKQQTETKAALLPLPPPIPPHITGHSGTLPSIPTEKQKIHPNKTQMESLSKVKHDTVVSKQTKPEITKPKPFNPANDVSKYISYFDLDSLYRQSPWKIQTSAFNQGMIVPKIATQDILPINPINTGNILRETTTTATLRPALVGQTNTNNHYVRKMIATIEQVRTHPNSFTGFQFFAPGLQKSQDDMRYSNLNFNLNPRPETLSMFDTQDQTTEMIPTEIAQVIDPNAPPPPVFPVSGSNTMSSVSKLGLSRNRRTNRTFMTTNQPIVSPPSHVVNTEASGHIAFKLPVLSEFQITKEDRPIRRKQIHNIQDQHLNSLGEKQDSYDWQKPESLNEVQSKVDYITNPAKVLSKLSKLNQNHIENFQKTNENSKDGIQGIINEPTGKKNDPPPPIILETPNSPAFKVDYLPPPPPPPRYRPPTQTTKPHPNITSTLSTSKTSAADKIKTVYESADTANGSLTLESDPGYSKDLPNAQEICENCTYVSNFCYLRQPLNCNRFVVCYQQGNKIRATEKECSFGLFWSESKLACIQSLRADCQTDPCMSPDVSSHAYIGKCRAYWTCRRRRSDARCCPNGYGYGGGQKACVPNAECATECQTETIVTQNVCHLTAVQSSPFEYMDGGMIRSCAPGTRFKESMCTCIRSNVGSKPVDSIPKENVVSHQCGPDIKLDFSGPTHDAFDDKSGNSQSIGVFDVVQTMKEQAMFNGRGSLKLWRFSNVELGPELALKFRFYAHGQSMRSETLLSNCIGRKDVAAIDIRLETGILEIVFAVKTTESPETYMRMFYKPFQWNDVVMRYDGSSFSAAIGKVSKTIYVQGVIPTKHAAISIGGCGNDDGFIGYMDDIVIYNECIPDDVRDLVFE